MNESKNEVIEKLLLRVFPSFKNNPKVVKQILKTLKTLGVEEPQDLQYISPEHLIPPLKYVQACKLIEKGKKGKISLKVSSRLLSDC